MKFRTCTWKNLQKCPWKINSLREIFSKFTYVKIWRSIREKNDKFLTWKLSTLPWKKNEKKFVAFYNKDSLAVFSLQLYNIYLKSNAYVTALRNFNPAACPEIKIFDLQNRRMYIWVYEHWFQLRTTETFYLTLPCQDLTGARIWSFNHFAALIRFSIMVNILLNFSKNG